VYSPGYAKSDRIPAHRRRLVTFELLREFGFSVNEVSSLRERAIVNDDSI
jgi:hypothetical protein